MGLNQEDTQMTLLTPMVSDLVSETHAYRHLLKVMDFKNLVVDLPCTMRRLISVISVCCANALARSDCHSCSTRFVTA